MRYIYGTADDDLLEGEGGEDSLYGEDGNDVLHGYAGNDVLQGSGGRDTLDGGAGEDWAFYVDKSLPVRVTLTGSEETSTVYVGNVAEDTIRSIEGIFGGSSHDILTGDEQDNALVGWAGQDVLSGKSGSDRFVYMDPSNGGDTIQDFSSDEGDQIDLNFSLYSSDDQSLVFSESTPAPFSVWYEAAGHTKALSVRADTDGDEKTVEFSITLAGVASLTADDFIF